MDQQDAFAELRRTWTPPPGLSYGTPRQVRLTGSGIAMVVITAVMLAGALAVAIGLDYVARRQAEERRLLELYGADTYGVVTKLWRGSDKNRQRWVAYQFTVQGRIYQRSAKVSAQRWRELETGAQLPVRFLSTDPALSYPSGSEPKPGPPWLPCLVGLSMAAFSWVPMWQVRRQRQLLTEGRPAPGMVTRLRRMKGGMKVYYDFALLSGSTGKGSSGPMNKPPGLGQTVCVVYLPDNPRRNAVYPLTFVKVDGLN